MLPGAEGEAQAIPAIRQASLAALSPGRYAAVLTVIDAAGEPDSADPIAVPGLGISHFSTVYPVTHTLGKLLSAQPDERLIDRMWR